MEEGERDKELEKGKIELFGVLFRCLLKNVMSENAVSSGITFQ